MLSALRTMQIWGTPARQKSDLSERELGQFQFWMLLQASVLAFASATTWMTATQTGSTESENIWFALLLADTLLTVQVLPYMIPVIEGVSSLLPSVALSLMCCLSALRLYLLHSSNLYPCAALVVVDSTRSPA
ncbi:MAG: hypothetical protein MHM6MM_003395 [Cercozoa sp. M6MM]